MSVFKNVLLLPVFLVFTWVSLSAQEESEVVLKAMEDELNRSMQELSLKDHDRPFFISYRVFDSKSLNINASLGAVNNAMLSPRRRGSVRLIVGDYDFNDESFASQGMSLSVSNQANFGFVGVGMPLGADYYGIRRYFWKSTDNMYRRAAKRFKAHQSKLKKEGKKIDETPHLVFSKVPVVSYQSERLDADWDQKAIEDRARKISAAFVAYPDIGESRVNLSLNHSREYYINTEGTRIVQDDAGVQLKILVFSSATRAVFNSEDLNYQASSFDELPDDATILADIEELVKKVRKKETVEQFEDSYEGPVLFYDQSVAGLFARHFVPSLNATQTASIEEETGFRNRSRELDHKIDKRVTSRSLSLSVLPGRENYLKQSMKGAYRYDMEGVKATDSLLIVDKGYLKELMRGRTVLKDSPGPNGTGQGVGVLSVISHDTKTETALKQQLIELAEDEGLEYALIVRKIPFTGGGVNVYKISLEDGSETLLQSASLNDLNFNSFRKVGGTSTDRTVHHLPDSFNGKLMSVVSPRILLLEDVEVESFQNYGTRKNKKAMVQSPLVKE
ncbi:MAG: hypothetical protein HEP71_25015 [Roseivirga sp.]|nr:hypothetical protein [Roseivirga sp.]